MNKQQLAAKIWESANKMRSKIEANEYKDYILGFMFYKFISDKELKFLKENDFSNEDIKALDEEDSRTVEFIQNGIGYFITYDNLFSTWIVKGKNFDVSNVRDALSAFTRLISSSHKKVFDRIFDTLQTGLSKLGDSAGAQTKAISELIQLIKNIPMDGKQDYDVLGFVYEYLLSMFAANAGKKAGEFYTPHEVSLLMSEIVAEHLKGKNTVKIYDPTSGSGSLLINIGKSVSKYIDDKDNIKYYAQELKENTYNLTRMNLIMRGILADNIVTRNGDTLEEDWPFFDDNDPVATYDPLYVDAVVSNPPYSQVWDSSNKETDPRYARFGLAPKTKADFAFLLHDLYHIKSDGIMTIVLPHGVLFRGGEEGEIRKNLIEQNHIDVIIGLPANIFFGTGIPTVIMVLKQKRENTDVLIVDASKGFIKVGKNNKLQAAHIKKITDTVINRENVDKFSRKVSLEEIRQNEYNLNIPRYVNSSEDPETWDIYATMFGGIPRIEIEELKKYWLTFPGIRKSLFTESETPYVSLLVGDIKNAIKENSDVKVFVDCFRANFADFNLYLKSELINKMNTLNISKEEVIISREIFNRLAPISLIDKYDAYQALDDEWVKTVIDLEIIQTEGFEATKRVDPNMVLKKKDGKEQEVQEGWIGHIIPFELIQGTILSEETQMLDKKINQLSELKDEYNEIIDSLSEEEKDSDILNDNNDSFVSVKVIKELKRIFSDIETEEIQALNGYISLLDAKAKKTEKEDYINLHTEVNWNKMESNKDGTYAKKNINSYIAELRSDYKFHEESFEEKLVRVGNLMVEEKELKSQVKEETTKLHLLTKKTIENLNDEQVLELLELKWITPLVSKMDSLLDAIVNELVAKIQMIADKYAVTYSEVEAQINDAENTLSSLIDELVGSEYDMKGLNEFQSLLKGE